MQYCKYHPILPATYHCEYCESELCDSCLDPGNHKYAARCFICGRDVASLGARYSAEPFWRRLKESFHYPLTMEVGVLIVVVSLLTSIAIYIPFGFILSILMFGVFMKYCFACIELSAQGNLQAPDITAAYGGGFILAIRLIVMMTVMFTLVFGAILLSRSFGILLGLFLLCSLPAILICFAATQDMLSALNPLKIVYLISAVGLPYGLLLILIMVMIASVSVINSFIGYSNSFTTITLQSIVSNYYTVVVFHIMGYLIFQYQEQLGFIAREEGNDINPLSERDLLLTKIAVEVKEGDYVKALSLFQKAVKQFPDDHDVLSKCFDFLVATKQLKPLNEFAIIYFHFLKDHQRIDQLVPCYKRVKQLIPNYMPYKPEDRLFLAEECYLRGDPRSVLALIKGIPKQFSNFAQLPRVYELLAEALKDLPGMVDKAEKCSAIAKKLRVQEAQEKQQKPKANAQLKPKTKSRVVAPKNPSLEQQIAANSQLDKDSDDEQNTDYDGGIDFK